MQTEQQSVAPPTPPSPTPADSTGQSESRADTKRRAGLRFVVGSVFGIAFLVLFVIVYIIAQRGPDSLSTTTADGKLLGVFDTAGDRVTTTGKARPRKDEPAPDFALTDSSGNYVRLKDLRGKTILLNFWASWCGPCQQEAPDLQKFYLMHKADNVVVLGVDYKESVDDVKRFYRTYKLFYPTVMDTDGRVTGYYRASAFPETYFIDKNGIVRTDVIYGAMTFEQMMSYLDQTWAAGGK